jgi:hypothetical protein
MTWASGGSYDSQEIRAFPICFDPTPPPMILVIHKEMAFTIGFAFKYGLVCRDM